MVHASVHHMNLTDRQGEGRIEIDFPYDKRGLRRRPLFL
jgi:hypothetical protein